MARSSRLTAAFVKTANAPGRYGDGRGGFGLKLLVKQGSGGRPVKSWIQRLRIDSSPFDLGLGSYPLVTLADARLKALDNARAVTSGDDPRRPKDRPLTFADAMERTIEVLRPGWKEGGKAEPQMRYLLTEYVLPHIGRRPIDSIQPADLLAFLAPLAIEKGATGSKIKSRMGQVFQWAIAQGLRADNPADKNINQALPKASTRDHFRALPFADVGAAVRTIRESNAWPGTKLAFEFLVLTAGRSGEIRRAEWREMDLDGATWTIPAARMKSRREHRIPLSAPALDVLGQARELSDCGLVFPGANGKPQSDSRLSKLLRENSIAAVPHGFRSSFRDWCANANVDRQTAESALAHTLGDATEQAYLRSDLFDLRRSTMEEWGRFVQAFGTSVIHAAPQSVNSTEYTTKSV